MEEWRVSGRASEKCADGNAYISTHYSPGCNMAAAWTKRALQAGEKDPNVE